MTKDEAVKLFVERDLSAIPQDWVQLVDEARGPGVYNWPMWGTMFLVDDHIGERLMKHSRLMVGDAEEIDLDTIEDKKERKEVKQAIADLKREQIAWGGVAILEQYVDEEMAGAHCILDTEGDATAAYIYEVDERYLIGVHGAGWNFYDGVWDKIYDVLGLQWHNDREEKVVIEVSGGVAECTNAPSGVKVEIIDHDNA